MSMSHALSFTYRKSSGEVSVRTVSSWSEDGNYIKGYCADGGMVKTFRKDRVTAWHGDSESLLMRPNVTPAPNIKGGSGKLEILFTGFPKGERAALEHEASANNLLVRKTVTAGLSFLCAGPNAGPAKVAQAVEQGVWIVPVEGLREFYETGEVPDHIDGV